MKKLSPEYYETCADDVMVGEGIGFMRIRRITGYLVGTLEQFNNAKRAEEADRVKHSLGMGIEQLSKKGV